MLHFEIYVLFANDAAVYRSLEPLFSKEHSFWHLKVKSSVCDSGSGISGSPVRHDDAAETPPVPEHINVHPSVLSGMHPVHRIVAVHHSPDTGFPDSLAERREIDFIKSPFVHIRADTVAGVFLVVGCKMLHGRHHTLFLHSYDIMLGSLT